MNFFTIFLIPAIVLTNGLLRAEESYPPHPDSVAQEGVPKGELVKGTFGAGEKSVFPGTERDYQIYLPVGFDKSKPAPFMVFQDGVLYNAPVVFDNLIAKKDIPQLVGVFIKPGVVPAANENALPRFNRSYEYDSVTDTYSKFLIDEFLPAIEAKHGIKLSTDPNDAAICGNSSGGICAFMAAWHRPDRFRRVFSGVGTYVGIRGADQLPVLVRKTEPKPLRVYLQSGEQDNNLYCGDWWMANQMMERSLTWAGYDVNHTWGTGGHNQKQATAIFPDVMRRLWRDYATAKEIKVNPRGDSKWRGYEVLGDGKWELIPLPKDEKDRTSSKTEHLAAKLDGAILILTEDGHHVWSLSNNQIWSLLPVSPRGARNGYALGMMPSGKLATLTDGFESGLYLRTWNIDSGVEDNNEIDGYHTFICLYHGRMIGAFPNDSYDSEVPPDPFAFGDVGGGLRFLDETEAWPGIFVEVRDNTIKALCASPDQTTIYAVCRRSDVVHSVKLGNVPKFPVTDPFETQENAKPKMVEGLTNSQPFGKLEPDAMGRVGAKGLCVDTEGRLYVATTLGIQVCDQAGRVNFIISTPQQPHDVCFGGKDLGELFIACGDTIYKRKTKVHGYISGQMAPIKPVAPKL